MLLINNGNSQVWNISGADAPPAAIALPSVSVKPSKPTKPISKPAGKAVLPTVISAKPTKPVSPPMTPPASLPPVVIPVAPVAPVALENISDIAPSVVISTPGLQPKKPSEQITPSLSPIAPLSGGGGGGGGFSERSAPAEEETTEESAEPEKNKSKKYIVIGIGIIALATLAYIFLRKKKK